MKWAQIKLLNFLREREKEITPIIQWIFVHWSSHEGDSCLDLKE